MTAPPKGNHNDTSDVLERLRWVENNVYEQVIEVTKYGADVRNLAKDVTELQKEAKKIKEELKKEAKEIKEELSKKIDKATSKIDLIAYILVAYGAVGAMGIVISAPNLIGWLQK